MSSSRIALGDECVDTVSGYKGIAVATTLWLNGCVRVYIQAAMGKDGKVPDAQAFDEPQLKVTRVGKVKVVQSDTGGPIPAGVFSRNFTPKRRS